MMKPREHIVLIDYMRGIASVMVAWFHLTNIFHGSWIAYLGKYGYLGVEIFFVISGFVIALALYRRSEPNGLRSFGIFIIRRLIRLEPPYVASILLAIGLLYLSSSLPGFRGPKPDIDIKQVLFHFAYLIPFTNYTWVNLVYWTLTYEFFFYIVAGIAIPFTQLKYGRFLFVALTATAAVAVVSGLASPLIMLFVLGIGACRFYLDKDGIVVLIAVMLMSAGAMFAMGDRIEAAFGLLAAGMLAGNSRIPALHGAAAKTLTFLGAISYSLYLIHVPVGSRVINFGSRFVDGQIAYLCLSVAALALCCVFAAIFWRLIERPAMIAASRWGRRESPSTLPIGQHRSISEN